MQIAVLATGGTIASRLDGDGRLVVSDDIQHLLASVAQPSGVELVGIQLRSVPSFALAPDDMLGIAREVRDHFDRGFDGVIVTHGTDTLEETAYLMSQYFSRDARLVVTGAQRGADEPDSDGPRNFADAVRVTSGPTSLGPVVVMGGLAVAAVDARKVHTSSLLAFSGGEAGVIALVDDNGVHLRARAQRGGYYSDVPLPERLPRVDLVKLVAGADGLHVNASLHGGAQGIILEAFGSGNATPAVVDAVRDAIGFGISVVITSRTGGGRARSLYGSRGGGADLADAGAYFASDLTGQQARMALSMVLADSTSESPYDALDAMINGRLR